MLLEMDLTTVSHLLTDDTALSAAITRAKQELITGSHHHQQHHKLPQQIAETLYEAVSEIYEKNTPKITGSYWKYFNRIILLYLTVIWQYICFKHLTFGNKNINMIKLFSVFVNIAVHVCTKKQLNLYSGFFWYPSFPRDFITF
jgi:hypothetical protein